MQSVPSSANTAPDRPKISVAMASYNGSKFIREQIKSILVCLSGNDELVISDDGSTDGTQDIVRQMSLEDGRIKLINGPGGGVVRNFENALMSCTGDVIFLSDQDDVWHKDKVQKVLPLLKENILVCHNAAIFNSDTGQSLGDVQSKTGAGATFLKNMAKNCFMGCCMAFKRELLNYALPFPDKSQIHIHDWWLGLLAIKYGKVAVIGDCLIDYRIHQNNTLGFNKTSLAFKIKKRINMYRAYRARVKQLKKGKQ